MKTLYLNCFSGISGNMFIGALLDLGIKAEEIYNILSVYGLDSEDIILKKVDRQGIQATYFNLKGEEEKLDQGHSHHHHDHGHVHDDHHNHSHEHTHHHKHSHHRGLKEVEELLAKAPVEPEVIETAKQIFYVIAEAESKVHNMSIEEIHFHEVGELDSIVDCLLASYLFHILEVDYVVASNINTGSGIVNCAHGEYPVPAPATLEVLTSVNAPIGGIEIPRELTTPTGAAIIATLVDKFSNMPKGRVLATGYGAGTYDNKVPNVLRATIIEDEEEIDPVWFSCNVDDMTGEELGFLMDKLFEVGAKDVTFTPIFMKKNRPGQRIDVLGNDDIEEQLVDTLFTHSSTLGIKKILIDKIEFHRSYEQLDLKDQTIDNKIGYWKDMSKESFEFEDIKRSALAQGISIREALKQAERAKEIGTER